ncbi:hypothetical protein [Calothrix sp. PCC 7507]|uniref:hypothetical protein n=1 Tax=Calothrix sp. PCC 7507 TaxID=99598 RepID=UPI00029F1A84|nr:hypothetical protein [Calothrix sp. PCC 7507]AFY32489.1 hypothetical protein Cal7507_2046 [Calothrix sp. PCC 7507]
MNSRVDEIQRLIADIDKLLATASKRQPKLLSVQAQEPREILERTRDLLAKLGESDVLDSSTRNKVSGQQPLSPLLAKFVEGNIQSSTQYQEPDEEQSPTVLPQQLNSEFTALLQPLRSELAGLLQERTNLVQEIRLLEQRRSQNYSLSQQLANQEQVINEFLQVLMNRLASHLAQTSTNSPSSTPINPIAPFLGTSNQAERLTQLTRELDQRLVSLDGTVNVVFEALQRNIQSYHESLSQALSRMHSQGVQGEQLMASFFQNLTQHLQQQSPGYQPNLLVVHETLPVVEVSAALTEPLELTQPETTDKDPDVTEDLDAVLLQFAQNASPASETTSAIPSELQPDRLDAVDQLYASLFGNNDATDPSPTDELSVLATASPSALNIPETPTEQLLPLEAVAKVPDPWLESPDADVAVPQNPNSPKLADVVFQPIDSSSQLWDALFADEDSEPAPSLSISSLPPTEVAATESLPTQLASADTITYLTDLLVDFGEQEQLLPVSSPEAVVTTPTVTTVTERSEVVVSDEEQEQPLDNYILASPQENLLSPVANAANTIPDISLDDVQLQQLELDLANLDITADWDSYSQQELYAESQQTAAFSRLDIPQLVPTSIPQPEVELDFSPTSEKKKEVTIPNSDSKHPEISLPNVLDSIWYLGIDLGTTGISAALLNHSTAVVYPIHWSAENQAGATSFQQSLRLPAEVYLPAVPVPQGEGESTEASEQKVSDSLVATDTVPKSAPELTNNLYSAQLKPYLQVAIPYKNARQKWEPVLQFNEFSAGPLIWVVRSLSKLLSTLKSDRHSTTQGLTATAVGLDEKTFSSIISNIAGVICTCPASWSEQYRFNVREALLTSKIVPHPQQVFFIEEAIASLLSVLDGANGENIQVSDIQGLHPIKSSEQPLVGSTLAINIGATATEMALVDLPDTLVQLAHQDFMLHSFAYAGKGIEQDIICQLLLPPKSRQSRAEIQGDDKTITSNPWHWQPSIPGLDQMQWQSLGLEELELPRVGEPDITVRIRLQQRLESSLLGQAVLDAALALKLILQHHDSFTLDLADQRWVLQRRDLETQVLVPFVRRLNRELNKLLVARGIPTEAINQAILTGGVASINTVNRWLRQKLPNAKILQDSYLGDNGAPNCSRVAYGLAMLPLHPQVLDIPRQQYTDYFLFTELLRLLPDRSLSFSEVVQLFEGRGINTRTCQQRLLAFLEGELPPGLIPNNLDSTWLTQSSHENPDYQAIAATPLFEKQGSLSYRPNSQQLLSLRHYLEAIKASTQQSLEEPYLVNFALEVSQ